MKKYVIDASVVLKWYFPDEEGKEKALELYKLYIGNGVNFCAPSLLDYEVINAISIAVRRKRVGEDSANKFFIHYSEIEIEKVECKSYREEAFNISKTYSRSFYDSCYLALALNQGIPFVTGDKKLYHSVNDKFPLLTWIEDI